MTKQEQNKTSKAWVCGVCRAVNVTARCGCKLSGETAVINTIDALNAIDLSSFVKRAKR